MHTCIIQQDCTYYTVRLTYYTTGLYILYNTEDSTYYTTGTAVYSIPLDCILYHRSVHYYYAVVHIIPQDYTTGLYIYKLYHMSVHIIPTGLYILYHRSACIIQQKCTYYTNNRTIPIIPQIISIGLYILYHRNSYTYYTTGLYNRTVHIQVIHMSVHIIPQDCTYYTTEVYVLYNRSVHIIPQNCTYYTTGVYILYNRTVHIIQQDCTYNRSVHIIQ